jgi:LytS/YehU family sensor histidine kinase
MYKVLQQNNAILQEKLTLENLAKTTELELLKTQLNPHFLFNALNSIKALVIINPEQSRDAIVKLSELLRFTLQYGKEMLIPLNDEMKEVKKYLELEQLRFGKRLHVEFNIDDNTFSQTIPPAIILSLAENAIKHGVAKQMGESTIRIQSCINENKVEICVENTGNYAPENTTGIGLKHITRRLEEVFHHKAAFTITQQNTFVKACIKTPLSWQ